MIGNLIDNAGKWATSRVQIGVMAAPPSDHAPPQIHIIVDDDGPGLPEEKAY